MAANPKINRASEQRDPRDAILAALNRTRGPFADARTLPAAVYTSEDIFRIEQIGLFNRQWLCVGRAADIPSAGDYFVKNLGVESIIVIRGADGPVRAFHNVCRHRGSRLLDVPQGRGLARILCPYHAWSYNLDGSIQNAPQMPESFCKADHGLGKVRSALYEGFIFINLDEAAPSLESHFSDMPDLARYRMADLVCGKRIEYDVAANWKFICENYSECYHCAGVHPQLFKLCDLIARHERSQEIGKCFNGGPMKLRDGIDTMSMSGKTSLPTIPGLTHDDGRYVHYYVVYPNLLLSPHPDYVLVHTAWPSAPGRTKIICEWLFTQEAVNAKPFDPADVVEFWDVTNRQDWALCERAQRGAASRGFLPGPYQPTEDCVQTFDQWYANQLAPLLT
jgi:glycine betaine catabolism A